MPAATLTSKGQLTLPRSVRTVLHLEAGDRVDFVDDGEGGFRLVPLRKDASELRGRFAGRVGRTVSVQAMRVAVEAEAVSRRIRQK